MTPEFWQKLMQQAPNFIAWIVLAFVLYTINQEERKQHVELLNLLVNCLSAANALP